LFETQKREFAKRIQTELEANVKKQEQKLKDEMVKLNKKISQAERNMVNKVKLMQGSSAKSTPAKETPLKMSQSGDQVKLLKARVTNVEKSYEFSK